MAEAKFYTYVHRRADTGVIFYVGKGTGRRARFILNRNPYWQHVAAKHGYEVEIVAYFYAEEDAFSHEREMIAELRRSGVKLANLTEGGEGTVGRRHTAEARAKMSEAAAGRKVSDATREKLSMVHQGRVMTAEHRANLSEANRRRFSTPEGRQKARECQLGKTFSEEHRAKISAAKKGNSANRGRVATQEAKARMSIAQRARWSDPAERVRMSERHKSRFGKQLVLDI